MNEEGLEIPYEIGMFLSKLSYRSLTEQQIQDLIVIGSQVDNLANKYKLKVDKLQLAQLFQQKLKLEAIEIFNKCFEPLPTIIEIVMEISDSMLNLLKQRGFEGEKILKEIFMRALKHFREKMENNMLQSFFVYQIKEQNMEMFRSINAIDHYGGGSEQKVPLLPDTFNYQLLPDNVRIKAMTEDINFFKKDLNYEVKINNFKDEQFNKAKNFIDDEEKKSYELDQEQKKQRFLKFLSYFKDKNEIYPAIKETDLEKAAKVLNEKFIGIKKFSLEVIEKMKLFTSRVHQHPKGMIWYGPPGTGKSAISISLMKEIGLFFVTTPMAAGDIKKGIVGDSERTLNAIADRARLVPWDTCVLIIDEIDSLVPDRDCQKNQQGSNNNDLIGVFLSIMDGAKIVKNLKVIGTTNLLNSIDAAMRRRLDIQVFLGNPSRKQRLLWIDKKKKNVQKKY